MHLHPRNLGRLAAILAMGASAALAQGTQTANITGEVVDGANKPIVGVTVRLSSPALQGVRTIVTDAAGHFAARLLPPGEYKIVLTKDGFETRTLTQRVGLEQTFSPRVKLSTAATAVVEVIAADVAVDKTEVKSAQNYTKETIDSLPVGRSNLLNIVYLSPGVVENASEARGGVSIRGSMGSGNLFLVDGQNVNDNLYNGQRIGIIFDSIDETQVLTGALPAEYGDVEGGVVNSISKSGGDEFTGSFRWDLQNPGWNAVKPMSDRTTYGNNLGEQRSFQVDGPIIKSKLWFHFAYFDDHPRLTKTLGQNYFYDGAADAFYTPPAVGYQAVTDDYRREFKLTWAINQNHTVSASWHNYKNVALNDYGAGEYVGLTNLYKTGEFWNVAWRSTWSTNLTSSVRYGEKKQELGSYATPGADTTTWPLYSGDDGLTYRNSIFNPQDPQPDLRNNKTANIKLTYFLEANGSHQLDFGYDLYQGTTKASGDQAPPVIKGPAGTPLAGKRLNVWWVDMDTYDPKAGLVYNVYDVYMGEYVPDMCTATSQAFYVNDKWVMNQQWVFQLGLRADSYDAKGQVTDKISSATSFSPRLGAKWDVRGDAVWVAGLSFARYNGRVLEATLQNRTYVNNSRYYGLAYTGPSPATYAQIQNPANYDFSSPIDFSDAAFNKRIDKGLKPQTVDEIQASMAYSFKETFAGTGFAKLTFVNKKWGNLIDYRAGNDGKLTDSFGNSWYIQTYYNNPDATRQYHGLELELNTRKGPWNLAGYVNWSRLRGNFVGEGAANPGRGQGLSWFTIQDGQRMYNPAMLNPDGYLPGHVPLRMRWTAMYNTHNSIGKQTWGFLYSFDSGAHYSDARTVRRAALTSPNGLLDPMFGSSGTQYLSERGNGVFNGKAYLDFSFQQEAELFKIRERAVMAFFKVDVTNLFNHQQQVTWDTNWNSVGKTGSYRDPWVAAATYGQPVGANNYGDARTIRVSAGVKF